MRNTLLVMVISGVTLILNGCSPEVVDIDGEDNHVFIPEGEVVVSLGSSIEKGPNRRDNTLSVGYARGEGEFDQRLNSSEYVDVEGVQINGPIKLYHKADLGVGYLRFVRHMFNGERFEWYWGAGLGFSELNLTTTDGTQEINTDNSAAGVSGLVGLAYSFHPMFGIETNLAAYVFPTDDESSLYDLRAQMVFTPVETLRLYAGYRHWGYHYNPHLGDSDVLFDFYGPTAGVTLHF